MDSKYVIGIDYGTLSGRVLLVEVASGRELAVHETYYPHTVMDEKLPNNGTPLEEDWALQHPDDYLEVLRRSVPEVLRLSGVKAEDVIGVGIDFTSCTMLPIDAHGVPLCFKTEFSENPHAYVKLWKHHAAQEEADRLNEAAEAQGQAFLKRYGGKISSEWMLPKLWQILNEAPEIYERMDRFVDGADWIVLQLTGQFVRSSCTAGYKALWHKEDGYPDAEFLRSLDPRLEDLFETRMRGHVSPIGSKAGELTSAMAKITGLVEGTAVAVGLIDAHAAVPGVGAVKPGQLVMAMGTSLCHMLLADKEIHAEGICGVVEDGIIPGLFGYEAGQPAVGDIFGWYVEQGVPAYVHELAKAEGLSMHQWLEKKAAAYEPGESGLLALDWWNGNRSVLVEANLSGLIVGYNLLTKPEEIYRALLEATAFGTRRVIDAFQESGVEVTEIYACGGLPERNRLLMQIFADVTGREIRIAASSQNTALGAAMFGAVAAGSARGGYDTIVEAAESMVKPEKATYLPKPENVVVYNRLYHQYCTLHDYFGRTHLGIMKELKALKLEKSS
ncbi:ribulokinase [Neobacillus drentensis]|uniref:ribulokinase n=1 Tax=Neobacillus drentensis TaxID=220684 RepID=UPI002FFEABDF